LVALSDPGANEAGGRRNAAAPAARDQVTGPAASTDAHFRAAAAILAMRPGSEPDMSAALLERHYGLAGSLATLSSEIERTVAVDLPEGRHLILKTSTRPEAVDSFRFQAAVIAGLRGAAGFVAPEVLPTSDGALVFEHEGVCGYLQTRLEGIALHQAQPQRPTCSFELAVLSPGSTWPLIGSGCPQRTVPSCGTSVAGRV
jgi:hypothetical protein